MSTFAIKAARTDGAVETITLTAPNKEAAIRDAGSRGLVVLDVRAAEGAPTAVRLSRRSLLEFTQSMAALLRSGVTVRDALEIAESMFATGSIRLFCFALQEELARGRSFADSVSACAEGLPPLYRSMVHVGERVGSLAPVFERLALYLGDSKRLRDRVIGALMYPAMVLVTSLAGAVALIAIVVPRLAAVFAELGSELPPSYTIGKVAIIAIIGLICAGALLAAVLHILLRSARRRGRSLPAAERFLLHVPLLGRYLLLRDTLNLCFALETLTGSGLTVEDALRDAAEVIGSRDYRSAVVRVREALLRGERLSAAIAAARPIPERLARWAQLGERIGAVESVFGQIRVYYQEEMERWTSRLTALVEPALILFVGAIIMTIVVALIVPFFSLYGSVQV